MRSAIKKLFCLLLVLALLPLPGVRASTAGCTSAEARDNYLSFVKKNLFRDFVTQEIILDAVENGSFSGSYAFRDLDHDGVDDLVLWLGAGASEGELMTFTMYDNAILYTGSIPCLGIRPHVLCADHDTDIIVAEIYHGETVAYSCRIVNYRLKVISEGTTIPMRWKEITWEGDLPVSDAADAPAPEAPAPAPEAPAPAPEAPAPAPDAPAKGTPPFAPNAQGLGTFNHLFDGYREFVSKHGFAWLLNKDLFRHWAMAMTEQTYYYEDIDNDGTEELIVLVYCDALNMCEMLVVGMYNGHTECVPDILSFDTPPTLSGSRSEPGLLVTTNSDGLEHIRKLCYEEGRLVSPSTVFTPTGNNWYALEAQ